VPEAFVDRIFAVMALAQRHTFQILTKRPHRAASYLNAPDREETIWRAMGEFLPPRKHVTELPPWPFPNVWLGTSVEQGTDAMRPRHLDVRHRIDSLVRAPAAVHFLSCEPLIGPLDLSGRLHDIEWVITGGESGPNHRPLDLDWVREIDNICKYEVGIPHFFKQVGGLTPKSGGYLLDGKAIRDFPDERTLADVLA
jgi:protein gp37